MSRLTRIISVANGDLPADLILANARVVNVFTGEIETSNVAICENKIAGVGDYLKAKQLLDLRGDYLAPGLINGHTHLESSMLDIGQYARAVVPRGTTAIVTDLHEIANVSGLEGIRYILKHARNLPLELFLMAPSCVPATSFETSGATLDVGALRRIMRWRGVIGLGEVMNFSGVLGAENEVLNKIKLAEDKIIDGHAPGLTGKSLTAYIAAGIYSDHESVSPDEATEKLKKGMYLMIREGSSEKNIDALLPLINDENYRRCLFVVDDRNCSDLLQDGDVDAVVRKAICLGLDPVRAIQMATINVAECFRLKRHGAIAPGYLANFIVVSELSDFAVKMVFHGGRRVAEKGIPLFPVVQPASEGMTQTVNIKPFCIQALRLQASDEAEPIIEVVPNQIITRRRTEEVTISDGEVVTDTIRDILKLVVVERHWASGNIGLGLVHGFGFKRGAIASSIAHDSHNIIAVGTNDEDIFVAVKEIEKKQGGLVVVDAGKEIACLELPIAGLLSDKPLELVVAKQKRLEKAIENLGTVLPSPFATLSFLALAVIPELRLTDLGLVDVSKLELVRTKFKEVRE